MSKLIDILGDEKKAVDFANEMHEQGIYVIAFSYPVVPKNMARIRLQLNANLTEDDINHALSVFEETAKKLDIKLKN